MHHYLYILVSAKVPYILELVICIRTLDEPLLGFCIVLRSIYGLDSIFDIIAKKALESNSQHLIINLLNKKLLFWRFLIKILSHLILISLLLRWSWRPLISIKKAFLIGTILLEQRRRDDRLRWGTNLIIRFFRSLQAVLLNTWVLPELWLNLLSSKRVISQLSWGCNVWNILVRWPWEILRNRTNKILVWNVVGDGLRSFESVVWI